MKSKLIVLFLIIAVAGAACSSSDPDAAADPQAEAVDEETPEGSPALDAVVAPDADAVVFVWTESGGCAQGGPNCARYVVTADGVVETYRLTEADAEVTGTIDQATLDNWLATVAATDIDALVDRAGPGEMTAAFDGVDFELGAPHAGIELSSVQIEFSTQEDFFAAATALAAAARDAAPLEIKFR